MKIIDMHCDTIKMFLQENLEEQFFMWILKK